MENYLLEVARVEKRTRTPFGPRYAWEVGEKYEEYLNVTAHDHDGNTVYFDTPAVEWWVTTGMGAAVVGFHDGNCWLTPPSAYCIVANEQREPRENGGWTFAVKAGDGIIVRASLKKTYANGNYVLNRVKLMEVLNDEDH